MSNYKAGIKTSLITLILNIILALIKIIAGIFGQSSAMLADGVHTLSDVFTTLVVIVGLKVASKKPDDNHPYGHERFESIFAKILSMVLIATGVYIGYESLNLLITGNILKPKLVALYAALLSILIKELMYRYTIKSAKKIKSISMEADAWHHRSDALSSIGTFIGILGARIGIPQLDPIAGIVVSIMIMKVGIDLYKDSISQLVDESANKEVIKDIIELSKQVEGVKAVNDLKTRVFANRIFVDIDIFVDPNITVKEGHDIAKNLHDKLEREIVDIKHTMVHVEPYEKSDNKFS